MNMPEPYELDEVALNEVRLWVRQTLAPHFVNEVDLRAQPDLLGNTIVEALLRMPGQIFDPVTITHPRDWWHALKQRWFPRWMLRRWPVRMTTTTFEPTAYYPLIKVPTEQWFLNVARFDREELLRG